MRFSLSYHFSCKSPIKWLETHENDWLLPEWLRRDYCNQRFKPFGSPKKGLKWLILLYSPAAGNLLKINCKGAAKTGRKHKAFSKHYLNQRQKMQKSKEITQQWTGPERIF